MLHYYTKFFFCHNGVQLQHKYINTTHNVTYASLIHTIIAPKERDHSKTFSLPLPRETCEPEQNKELDET
jgi:hypothetical protein